MTDDRRNLPSASGLERIALCPGSWMVEKDLPELPEREWTASGTRMHRALAGEAVELSDEEQETVEHCRRLLNQARETVDIQEPGCSGSVEVSRWWIPHAFSGQMDVVFTKTGTHRWLIADFKTGRLETEPAPSNWQLRAYAALVGFKTTAREIVVAIIAPWQSQRLTMASYSPAAIREAIKETTKLATRAWLPNQPLIPGEKQCRYCRALSTCKAAMEAGLSVSKELALVPQVPVTKIDLANRAALLPSDTLAAALDRIGLANLVIDALKAEAKARLKDGLEVPGWHLKPGAERERIVDLTNVWTRTAAHGVTPSDFVGACSISKKNLGDLLREATGEKGKALADRMEQVVAGCVEVTTCEPSLERVKE